MIKINVITNNKKWFQFIKNPKNYIERKIKSNFLTKSVQKINNYSLINKVFTEIADRGIFS